MPILKDIAVTPPDASVPPELAEFSGVWIGKWRSERTNDYMADQILVFEKISQTSVTLASMGIGRYVGYGYSNDGRTWLTRYDYPTKLKGNSLMITNRLASGWTTFQVKDGRLTARGVYTSGYVWVGTFEKIQLQ